jgi:hypothetical protein
MAAHIPTRISLQWTVVLLTLPCPLFLVATTRDRFTAMFEGRRPMRILLEASTESEWVAQHLETFGHTVIVADPTFAPMCTSAADASKPIAAMSPRWPRRVSGCRSWCGAGAAAARS